MSTPSQGIFLFTAVLPVYISFAEHPALPPPAQAHAHAQLLAQAQEDLAQLEMYVE